jgi:predicted ATPase
MVGGEAGIGKSALVRAFCAARRETRVLWGVCDPLDTPRPLGPLIDIAEDVGGELAALVDEGATPAAILSALGHELRGGRPSIVVLEDLHWADEATLDVVRLLTRRIESFPALVLGSYRDDELDRAHPLRIALGESPSHAIERVVRECASRNALPGRADLHRRA